MPQPERRLDGCVVCETRPEEGGDKTIAHRINGAAHRNPGSDIAVAITPEAPPEGWLQALRWAAATETTAATATALPTPAAAADREPVGGPPGSVPAPSRLAIAADPRPKLPVPRVALVAGPVVYLVRGPFDLLGGLDESLPTSAGALADYSLRAREQGLANLASCALVSSVDPVAALSAADRQELASRYPASWPAATDPPSAALERAVPQALLAHGVKLAVTLDARSLSSGAAGTQVYVVELIRALDATGEVHIRALVGDDGPPPPELADLERVQWLSYREALGEVAPSDLVHRPQQVFTIDDLDLLRPLGSRLVLTQLDLIAYHNPSYFAEIEHWRRHVRATRAALDLADQVLFLSADARDDARREDLIDDDRSCVVPMGVETQVPIASTPECPLALAGRGQPFLLCLGSDYRHKNRPFALELTLALRREHGWEGLLVLAGAHVEHGSSAAQERLLLESAPELADAVVDLAAVNGGEREWLLSNAAAVAYPSIVEGFGLLPFEAAAAGTACLFAPQSALGELLPPETAVLHAWDVAASASAALPLLVDGEPRSRHIAAIRDAALRYTWTTCAALTLQAYERALTVRARSSARAAWEAQEREREVVRLDQAIKDKDAEMRNFRASLGPDGLALVGEDGVLSQEDQRALRALAARGPLRRGLFAGLRGGYRILHRDHG